MKKLNCLTLLLGFFGCTSHKMVMSLVYEQEYCNISNSKIRENIFTIVQLVTVCMEQFLPVFILCEVLNFLPKVLFVPLMNDKEWVCPECVW